uniref:Oxidase FUB9 n=1 Tax=Blastobotrys adeninivorans TaxID=409370 RepID=A0A060T411_BLAAD
MAPNLGKILNLADLEKAAMPMAEKQARDYWQTGANETQTVRENVEAFDRYRIRARAMRNVARVDVSPRKELFGKKYDVPVGIAPSAYHQMATSDGECATARAAKSHNWPMGLSSYSNKPFDEVKAAGGDSVVFFQLYVFKNRKTTEKLVKAVEKAGYKALLLTVDTPYVGQRELDIINNFKLPYYLSHGNFDKIAAGEVKPGVDPDNKAQVGGPDDNKTSTDNYATVSENVIDPSICWEETIPWLRSLTNMEIWVKGIATSEDAELAVQAGVDGIWVSNHGGRQLDSTLATVDSLPEVVDAVRGRVPVHVDGGIRRGNDIFKMLALGADFVWIGRPVIYGLQYDGQQGLELTQDILVNDFRRTMALAGCRNTSEIKRSCLARVGPAVTKL